MSTPDNGFNVGLLGGILIGLFAGMLLGGLRSGLGHHDLGSLGHTCFANKTCRVDLRCLVKEGLNPDGVCVKP